MQTNIRKTADNKLSKSKKESTTEDKVGLNKNEKEKVLKKSSVTPSTSRYFSKKPSAEDVYSKSNQKSYISSDKSTQKPLTTRLSTVSSLKDIPKTNSSVSIKTNESENLVKLDKKSNIKASVVKTRKDPVRNDGDKKSTKNSRQIGTPRTAKDLPFLNVTVNSPPSQRKQYVPNESKEDLSKNKHRKINETTVNNANIKSSDRQRQKTRTLNENEVKILTSEIVDNNIEMQNLTRKLNAKPKAFFVNIDSEKSKVKEEKNAGSSNNLKSSDDENYSYEDDFESYESDFESYHSESNKQNSSDTDDNDIEVNNEDSDNAILTERGKIQHHDEEKMLDSGNFELREAQKSANKMKPLIMDDIMEDSEDVNGGIDAKNKSSLTDEGFLEMSTSSGVSSMKNTDLLDR